MRLFYGQVRTVSKFKMSYLEFHNAFGQCLQQLLVNLSSFATKLFAA